MKSIPKDVELYIYRFIHESLMKEIVREYHSLYKWTNETVVSAGLASVDTSTITPIANYRFYTGYRTIHPILESRWKPGRCIGFLPNKYFYSSGLNSPFGYKK